MLDPKTVVQFCNKLNITVEDYLFLMSVYTFTEQKESVEEEEKLSIRIYYEKNHFYGRDVLNKKVELWSTLIDKLVKQGYLLDYRKNKETFKLSEFRLAEMFKNQIFSESVDSAFETVRNIIDDYHADYIYIKDNQISVYIMTTQDLKTYGELKDYFWKKIAKNGSLYHLGKFYEDLETHLKINGTLGMKLISFFYNYAEGELEKQIEKLY